MITKTTMVVIFNLKKFSFIDFVLTDRRSLSGKRPISASDKSSSCRFSYSAERNANTKATEYVTWESMAHAKDHFLKGGKWEGKSYTILIV